MKLWALLFIVPSCTADGPPQPDPCDQACAKMRQLSCEAAAPTPEGETCEQVCQEAKSLLNPACREKQASCEAMDENCPPL